MKIEDKTVVSIRYKMENSKGEILEDILDGLPINYLHGHGTILPSLEAELKGLNEGDEKQFFLSKETGFEGLDDEFHIRVIVDKVRYASEEELEKGLNPLMLDDYCGPKGCC
ncbi:peptidylprolyl isomerase [Pedobacter sp. V48]|uniref:FKBP-type peptidyl-prolyl cis-trans isomerase n=1 Tax=Pedobacter sp. V48 TaxID=509635 RepID=UPI0003E549BC|nr:hypothetical protein [Pedobacter sp. V48]ETZ22259.1 hypothetical protein N824_25355 [Pedobacter sp. V48]